MSGRRRRRVLFVVLGGVLLVSAAVLLACTAGLVSGKVSPASAGVAPDAPSVTPGERAAASDRLFGHVKMLAEDIGERCIETSFDELERSAVYIEEELARYGYRVGLQEYDVDGRKVRNIEAEKTGTERPEEIVVVGAHYDSAHGTPAANDNGSGVASLLELAQAMAEADLPRTVRFVAFVNEEPPYFHTEDMGSLRYAKRCKERDENIIAMLALETMGYFSDEPGSQQYPPLISHLYPDTGNFIAFVGDRESKSLVQTCVNRFSKSVDFPCEGASFPASLPGIGWSDHWSFWQAGYRAVMVTDTATYRYPHYHEPTDTPDKIDYNALATVTRGVEQVVRSLAGLLDP